MRCSLFLLGSTTTILNAPACVSATTLPIGATCAIDCANGLATAYSAGAGGSSPYYQYPLGLGGTPGAAAAAASSGTFSFACDPARGLVSPTVQCVVPPTALPTATPSSAAPSDAPPTPKPSASPTLPPSSPPDPPRTSTPLAPPAGAPCYVPPSLGVGVAGAEALPGIGCRAGMPLPRGAWCAVVCIQGIRPRLALAPVVTRPRRSAASLGSARLLRIRGFLSAE